MKLKAIVTTFIFIVFITEIYSQNSGWTWINRYPQGNTLSSSSIINSSTAFIVGDYGALLKTTNSGANWNNVFALPCRYYYTCIIFTNQNTGFSAGSYPNNYLYKTTDGANTWFSLNTGLNEGFNNVFFYNDNTGVAVGYNGRLIKTTDGGNAWVVIPPAISESYREFIGFNNSNACYARTSLHVLKSYSMGENWLNLPIPDSTRNVKDIFFFNENTGMYIGDFGYYGSSTKFVKTTDGGYSWFAYHIASGVQMCNMYFVNENIGYFVNGDYSSRSTIRKTTNGGINWLIQKDSITNWLFDVKFFNENTGFASGDYGNLLTTTNGGLNWNFYTRGFTESVIDVFFLNEFTGFISTAYNRHLMKTTNGGNSWDTVFIGPENINVIKFVNNSTGYIVGGSSVNQGFVYKTTNGGTNWVSQSYFTLQPVRDMQFLNELTGYAAGRGDNILKTTNGGSNWENLSLGNTATLYSISFVSVSTGFLAAYSGLYRTTNGGANWDYTSLGSSRILDICFANSQTGFVSVLYSPYLYKTVDQGLTWSPVNNSFLSSVSNIFFANANTGFILGYDKLYKTTDCGSTWGYQYAVTNELQVLHFINLSTGYVAGQNGKLLKTTNGGGNFVGVISHSTEQIPEHFSISQNYPNPFNPVTTIKFEVPKTLLNPPFSQRGEERSGGGFVKLTIYDILGREITTLVNQQLQPGSYSVTWDAANYPSGVYFYKIVSGDYNESKKIVLIK